MIVIIDGYNVLKQIFPGKKDTLEKQRSIFIHQLSRYKQQKEPALQEIIVVFDAGPSKHATREIKNGTVVVYSGTQMSADDWIIEWVKRNKGKEIMVVTLDRALREKCQQMSADWISSLDFYTLMTDSLTETTYAKPTTFSQLPEKFKTCETYEEFDTNSLSIDQESLDLLMEQASLMTHTKNEDDLPKQRIVKNTTLSKQERRLQKKIKKL